MFTIFANVFKNNTADLNIEANLGIPMLAYMWIASGLNLIGFLIQTASCCCACCGGRKARKQLIAELARQKDQAGTTPDGPAAGSPTRKKRFVLF